MDLVSIFVSTPIEIALAVGLTLVLVLAVMLIASLASRRDPLHNIHRIGVEARREMDRIADDFLHRQG